MFAKTFNLITFLCVGGQNFNLFNFVNPSACQKHSPVYHTSMLVFASLSTDYIMD